MNRASKLWLAAAGGVVAVAVAVVVTFGLTPAPAFPSLYEDGAPTVAGIVAHVDTDRHECVILLDVASGDSEEVYCDSWLWLEGWDDDGFLRVHPDGGPEVAFLVDPETGQVKPARSDAGVPPRYEPELRSTSRDGHATLVYSPNGTAVTLIDVDGPRDYAFWEYGLTESGGYVWVTDSEERLLVVAVDGSAGPWVVAEEVGEVAWK